MNTTELAEPIVLSTKFIFVRSEYKIIKIKYSQVLFIEAQADYIVFQLKNNQKVIVHATMKTVQEKLPSSIFVRVHRSFIINLNKISTIDNQVIQVKDHNIPIGAHYKEEFITKLNFL